MWLITGSFRYVLSYKFDRTLFYAYDNFYAYDDNFCSISFNYFYSYDKILMNYNLVYRYFKSNKQFMRATETPRRYFICG